MALKKPASFGASSQTMPRMQLSRSGMHVEAKVTGHMNVGVLLQLQVTIHWISLSTWDLGLEEIRAISDFAL